MGVEVPAPYDTTVDLRHAVDDALAPLKWM
jgi:hypothetical protein